MSDDDVEGRGHLAEVRFGVGQRRDELPRGIGVSLAMRRGHHLEFCRLGPQFGGFGFLIGALVVFARDEDLTLQLLGAGVPRGPTTLTPEQRVQVSAIIKARHANFDGSHRDDAYLVARYLGQLESRYGSGSGVGDRGIMCAALKARGAHFDGWDSEFMLSYLIALDAATLPSELAEAAESAKRGHAGQSPRPAGLGNDLAVMAGAPEREAALKARDAALDAIVNMHKGAPSSADAVSHTASHDDEDDHERQFVACIPTGEVQRSAG